MGKKRGGTKAKSKAQKPSRALKKTTLTKWIMAGGDKGTLRYNGHCSVIATVGTDWGAVSAGHDAFKATGGMDWGAVSVDETLKSALEGLVIGVFQAPPKTEVDRLRAILMTGVEDAGDGFVKVFNSVAYAGTKILTDPDILEHSARAAQQALKTAGDKPIMVDWPPGNLFVTGVCGEGKSAFAKALLVGDASEKSPIPKVMRPAGVAVDVKSRDQVEGQFVELTIPIRVNLGFDYERSDVGTAAIRATLPQNITSITEKTSMTDPSIEPLMMGLRAELARAKAAREELSGALIEFGRAAADLLLEIRKHRAV